MGCDCINSRSIPIPTKPISLISFLCCVPYFLKSLFSLSPFQIQVEWMDDLRFYALFNSISVIPGRWRMIMKGCVQWNPVYGHMLKQCFIAKEYTFGESSCTISFFFFFLLPSFLKNPLSLTSLFLPLRWMGTLSGEVTQLFPYLLPFSRGDFFYRKEFAPLGANSFLLQ